MKRISLLLVVAGIAVVAVRAEDDAVKKELDLNADEKALLETSRLHVKEVMEVLDKLPK